MLLIFSNLQTPYLTPEGGTVFDGAVGRQITLASTTLSGEFVVSGEDIEMVRLWVREGDGEVVFSGNGRISSHARFASGGITYGDVAIPIQITIGGIGGGVLFEGSVSRQISISGDAQGGIVYSGEGEATREWVREADGGFVLSGGNPKVLRTVSITVEGGIEFGGLASRSVLFSGEDVGGIVFAGSSDYVTYPVTGGTIFGGDVGLVTFTKRGLDYTIGTERHRGATTQTEIMIAMRDRIVDQDILLEHQVIFADDPSVFESTPPHDQYCIIMVGRKTVDQGQIAGGGTDADFRVEVFELRCYHRDNLDRTGTRDIWTLESARGAYNLARRIASQFQVHDLTNQSGTVIVGEPTRILSIGNPVTLGRKNGFGYVPVSVEVSYTEREP